MWYIFVCMPTQNIGPYVILLYNILGYNCISTFKLYLIYLDLCGRHFVQFYPINTN